MTGKVPTCETMHIKKMQVMFSRFFLEDQLNGLLTPRSWFQSAILIPVSLKISREVSPEPLKKMSSTFDLSVEIPNDSERYMLGSSAVL